MKDLLEMLPKLLKINQLDQKVVIIKINYE